MTRLCSVFAILFWFALDGVCLLDEVANLCCCVLDDQVFAVGAW